MDSAPAEPAAAPPAAEPETDARQAAEAVAPAPGAGLGTAASDIGTESGSPGFAVEEAAEPEPAGTTESPAGAEAGEAAAPPCAAPAPAPLQDADDGGGAGCGGGGGGGGGAEAETEPPPEAPAADPGADPAAVLGTVSRLPATAAPAAIAASHAAATSSVATMHEELAAAPPTAERPSGVPASRDPSIPPPAPPKPPASATPPSATLAPGGPGTTVDPAEPPPLPPSPTAAVTAPRLGGDTQITEADAARVRDSVDSLPTTDPALHATAGPTPTLTLDGDADPNRVATQATAVVTTTTELQAQAGKDVMQDFGDRDIYPHVAARDAHRQDRGRPRAGRRRRRRRRRAGGAPAAAGPDIGQVPPVVIDKLVDEDGADKVRASVSDQQTEMVAAKEKRAADDEAAQADSKRQLDEAVAASGDEQSQLRRNTARQADANRQKWADENAGHVAKSTSMATEATTTADKGVKSARTDSATKAQAEIDAGNRDIAKERSEAEGTAADKRREAKKESDSGGFFSWLGSKVASFFNKIKSAIKFVFDKARAAVNKVIKAVQKLAVAAIEAGRKLAVAAIELGGKALKAAGDVVLAGFPEARAKWNATIDKGVAAAKDKVNELADKLKAAAVAILDALGKALNKLLDVLEAGLLAAVSVVEGVVKGVIALAKAIADVFGDFLVIAAHVASGPVNWLKRLGGGVVDGFKNCAWPALKAAVKRWFKEKVEEVVGVGRMILDILVKGCITFAAVVKMAWAAIKESLPGIIISLLIEKVAALLIPALGGLKLIIDGLRAAWGAAQRILQAFKTFIAFLKSVKSGNPAGMFGQLVGAVAVAVLDFVANFVLVKLKGAGSKVGGTLKAMATKIMKGLKKVGGAAKKTAGAAVKGAKAAAGKVVGAAKTAGAKVVKGAKATVTKAGQAVAKTKVVKAVTSSAKGLARGGKKVADKGKQWLDKRKQKKAKQDKKKETPQQRLDRAVAAIRPQVERLLTGGVSSVRLWAQLRYWRARYRLSALTVGRGGHPQIVATVNPQSIVATAVKKLGRELHTILVQVGEELMADAVIRGELVKIAEDRARGLGAPGQARPGQSPAAEADRLQSGYRGKWQREDVEIAPGVAVGEQQLSSSATGHIKTLGIGASGHYKPHVQNALKEMKKAGMSDVEIREAMFSLMGRKTPTHAAFAGKDGQKRLSRLGAITRLVAHVEPGRHVGAHATTFMGWSLIGHGVTPVQAVTTMNPMSPGGATGQARLARMDPAALKGAKKLSAEAHLKRERAVTIRYLEVLMAANPEIFKTEADCIDWIRREFKEHLLERLRSIMWPGEDAEAVA